MDYISGNENDVNDFMSEISPWRSEPTQIVNENAYVSSCPPLRVGVDHQSDLAGVRVL